MLKIYLVLAVLIAGFAHNCLAQKTIKGRVLDERGFPAPGISVLLNTGTSSVTGSDGVFLVSTDRLSYNLTLLDESHSVSVLYEGMTRTDPELVLFGVRRSKSVNSEALKISFPEIPNGSSAIIKFISSDLFYSEEVTAASGESSKILTVDWPSSTDKLNGRIIYLEKTQTEYTKYAEQSLTVLKNFNNQSVSFEFATFRKPGQSTITLYMPNQNYNTKGFSVYADFLSLHRNSQLLLNSEQGDIISTKCLVPGELPLAFRLRVSGNGFYKDGDGFVNYIYSYPGSSLNISTETPPSLLGPQDKYEGYGENTEFSYEFGSGTGVYVVNFHSFFPDGDFYVVTLGRNITSPLVKSAGILNGKEFKWNVSKYLTYFNVDDFTKPKEFVNDVGYKAVTYSETRTFKKRF